MNTTFQLFPESASSVSQRIDNLFVFLIVVAAFFTALICSLILYFGVRYRRSAAVNRRQVGQNYVLEVVWSVIPLALTMVMFVWGALIFSDIKQPPADAPEVNVVAKQWMWKVQHPEGRAEINELHVPVGQPMRLRMISEDVIHSFYVPAFRLKQDVLPGYYTPMWFTPTKIGRYDLFCAEYCGTEHSLMRGTVFVMPPEDYADWLAGGTSEPLQVAGGRLFERFRCGQCHQGPAAATGPSLIGLFGTEVVLQDGHRIVVDEQYLRNSIVKPAEQVVAGFQPLMPQYSSQLDEGQVLQLVAYVKSLATAPPLQKSKDAAP